MSLLNASYQRPLTEGQYRGTIVSLEETEAHTTVTGQKVNAFVTIGLKLDMVEVTLVIYLRKVSATQ